MTKVRAMIHGSLETITYADDIPHATIADDLRIAGASQWRLVPTL